MKKLLAILLSACMLLNSCRLQQHIRHCRHRQRQFYLVYLFHCFRRF